MGTQPLIGRDELLAELGQRLDDLVSGGSALLIQGEAGVGKSALLNVVADSSERRGFRVLRATGVESEAQLPFAGLHQLLHPVLGDIVRLAPQQRDAIRSAFGLGSSAAPSVFLVGLAVLSLLDELAVAAPVVLVADDVQWLDPATVDVLGFIARRVDADPVLVLLGARSDTDTPFLHGRIETIAVEPLGDADARRLLDERAPGLRADIRRRILREASGNPLALIELPRAVEQRGLPPQVLPLNARLEHAFAGRLADLAPATRSALLVAAIDHRPNLAEVLMATRRLLARPVDVLVLEPAAAAGMIQIDGEVIGFRHPLVRSAIIGQATVTERHRAHAALAETLAGDPDRAAWHHAEATIGPDDSVAQALADAAARARDRGATRAAMIGLERAAALTTDPAVRVERLLGAAEAAFELGLPPVVDRLIMEAEPLHLSEVDRARVTWFREQSNDRVAGDPGAIRDLVETAERMGAAGHRDLALDLLHAAGLRCWWAHADPGSHGLVGAAAERLDPAGTDARIVQIIGLTLPVDAEARVRERVTAILSDDKLDPADIRLLGTACHSIGDFGRARILLERSEEELRRQARLGLVAQVLTVAAWDAIHLGRFDDADEDAQEAQRLAEETDQPIWGLGARIGAGLVAGVRGDRALAMATFRDAEAEIRSLGLDDLLAVVQLGRGLAAATAGRAGEAAAALDRVFDPGDPAWHELESFAAVGLWADAVIQAGRRAESLATLDRIEGLGRRTAAPILHAGIRHARAVFEEDDGVAPGLFLAAIDGAGEFPFQAARSQLAYGIWLRRRRRIVESRAPLRAAREGFERLRLEGWADQARRELRASGERSPNRTSAARSALSPQERQISSLAAEGLSNEQIAERLFLSPRTVGSHLYRAFPKLGIASRAELRDVLAPDGAIPQMQSSGPVDAVVRPKRDAPASP